MLIAAEPWQDVLFQDLQLRLVEGLPPCWMQRRCTRAQMIAGLQQSGQGRRVLCNDGVGASDAAHEVGAQLTATRPRCDAFKRVAAVESKHRHDGTARWLCRQRLRRLDDGGVVTLFDVLDERALQCGDAGMVLCLHERCVDVT